MRGPETVSAFISVSQTDPAERADLPSPGGTPVNVGNYGQGLAPEDQFMQSAKYIFGQNAILWKVGVSMIFEVDSVVSEIRAAAGREGGRRA